MKLCWLYEVLTSNDKYGTIINAKPAAMLQAPTPAFRMAVGYSSAVYTGIIVFPALMVNFPVHVGLVRFLYGFVQD